jgi:hypothetical protein
MTQYEYGIGTDLENMGPVHRAGMSKEEAEDWLKEWVEIGGNAEKVYIIRREVGQWVSLKSYMNDFKTSK